MAEDGEAVLGERWADALDIEPAKGIKVVVQANSPGRYDLLSKGAMTGTGVNRSRDRILGHLDVAGEAAEVANLAALPVSPDLRANAIMGRRVVWFTQTNTLNDKERVFYIDGKIFDNHRVDVRVPLGPVKQWTLRNDSDDLHGLHIHQITFQVTERNGVAVRAIPDRSFYALRRRRR